MVEVTVSQAAEPVACEVCGVKNPNHWLHLGPFNEQCHDYSPATHPQPSSEDRTGQLVQMPSVEELAEVIHSEWMTDEEKHAIAQAIIAHLEGKRP